MSDDDRPSYAGIMGVHIAISAVMAARGFGQGDAARRHDSLLWQGILVPICAPCSL